jgi:biopolymer transport protein ExbD
MAMSLRRGARGVRPVINVTPLVDVVLVLLIIFMVIVPLLEKELIVSLPTLESHARPPRDLEPLVLWVRASGEVRVGDEVVRGDRLEERLRELLRVRRDRTLFFQADDEVLFRDAVRVLDAAKGAGAETIGTVLGRQ